jgi:mycofactocin system glycosyltransferase
MAAAPSLDPSVRSVDGGRVLLGGSPLRLLTLSKTARDILAGGAWDSRAGRALSSKLINAGFAHPHPTGGPSIADVSVVIPVRNRHEAVRHLVAGLDPALEVIVVDDGSDPPVAGSRLRHETSRGPAAARNAGIALASRPFVALLDSDVVPPDGWLDSLLPHFSDSQLGAVAPRIVTSRGGTTNWRERTLARYDAARSPLDLGSRPARVSPGSVVSYLPAAALVLRRSALGEGEPLQVFDEGLRFGEDVDLIWRLISAGWTVRYEPAAAVGHAHRPTLRAAIAQRFGYGMSAAPLARRHPGKLTPFAGSRWTIAAWTLLATGHPRSAAATLAAAAFRLRPTLPLLPVALLARPSPGSTPRLPFPCCWRPARPERPAAGWPSRRSWSRRCWNTRAASPRSDRSPGCCCEPWTTSRTAPASASDVYAKAVSRRFFLASPSARSVCNRLSRGTPTREFANP